MRGLHPIALALALEACALGRFGGGGAQSSGPPGPLPATSAVGSRPSAADGAPPRNGDPSSSVQGHPAQGKAGNEPDDEHATDEGDDDEGEQTSSEEAGRAPPHPLDGWSRAKLEHAIETDPTSLGSVSIGYPNAGMLLNGALMPPAEGWTLVAPSNAWGTSETVDNLVRCIDLVRRRFPNTAKIAIGDISAKKGGPLSPHRSHQAGRDVDLGYYYLDGARWYAQATASNLDRARTWALVRALLTETDVELILIDRSIQSLLRAFAYGIGEDRSWVDGVFDGSPGKRPIIRHAKGHATHLHVRFYSPLAQETGRRTYGLLAERRLIPVQTAYTTYVAKKGDTLGQIAKKFATTSKAIRQASGLRSDMIRAGAEYRIARHGVVRPAAGPVLIPPRRLPPTEPPPQSPPAPQPATSATRPNALNAGL